VSVRSGGGGGRGEPRLRDPKLVAEDVRDELLDAEQAASIYGVDLPYTSSLSGSEPPHEGSLR
jgi:N-methylhydantoinase B/oxoprolinase/acetone carboxylase alpha subunit